MIEEQKHEDTEAKGHTTVKRWSMYHIGSSTSGIMQLCPSKVIVWKK